MELEIFWLESFWIEIFWLESFELDRLRGRELERGFELESPSG